MYKALSSHWENLSEEEQDSLSSSFWTDQESEGEPRECFVKDDCRDLRTEEEPGISKQENNIKRESFVKTDAGETEKRLRDEDQSEEERVTGEESENDSTGINSRKVSEVEEERESFAREDDTDKSDESRSDNNSDCNTEPSESEDEQESEEEVDEGLVKVESAENLLERKRWEKQNEEKATDEEELVSNEKISKPWAEDEETGGEDLSDGENEDEGSVKMFGRDAEESDDEEVERFGSLDRRVREDFDSDGLQNEEEMEYSSCEGNRGERMEKEEPASEEEMSRDDLDRFEQKQQWMGEAPKMETVLEPVRSEKEVGGYFMNKYNNFSNIEQTRLNEQKCVEQNSATSVRAERGDGWIKGEDVDAAEQSDGLYSKQRETDGQGVPEYSIEQHENNQIKEDDYDKCDEKEAVEDYRGSTDSPTVSILTSGYGTYRPDSPRDELDYRDDCTLTGLEDDCEYRGVADCEDDDCQFMDDHSLLETSEQQIPSLSLQQNDHSVGHCDSRNRETVQNTDDCQGEPAENRLGSPAGCNETDQEFDFAAESVKQISGIPSRVLEEGGCDMSKGDGCGEAGTVYQDYRHPFNLRLSKSVTRFEHRTEHRWMGEETRKPNKAKLHGLKCEPMSVLEERLEQLRVSAGGRRGDLESESEVTGSDGDGLSSATAELPSAFEAYMKGMKRSRSESDIRLQPKSFIRPIMDHPHTRNLKKTDPVAKYFQYKQEWEMFKAPGEKSRKELHWAIREQLMYQPPPPKPQRTYVPNTYVVPTEKKRSALRWEIRHDLANGIIPAKITYP